FDGQDGETNFFRRGPVGHKWHRPLAVLAAQPREKPGHQECLASLHDPGPRPFYHNRNRGQDLPIEHSEIARVFKSLIRAPASTNGSKRGSGLGSNSIKAVGYLDVMTYEPVPALSAIPAPRRPAAIPSSQNSRRLANTASEQSTKASSTK